MASTILVPSPSQMARYSAVAWANFSDSGEKVSLSVGSCAEVKGVNATIRTARMACIRVLPTFPHNSVSDLISTHDEAQRPTLALTCCRNGERSGRCRQSGAVRCSAQVLTGTLSKGVPLLVDPGETNSDPGLVLSYGLWAGFAFPLVMLEGSRQFDRLAVRRMQIGAPPFL